MQTSYIMVQVIEQTVKLQAEPLCDVSKSCALRLCVPLNKEKVKQMKRFSMQRLGSLIFITVLFALSNKEHFNHLKSCYFKGNDCTPGTDSVMLWRLPTLHRAYCVIAAACKGLPLSITLKGTRHTTLLSV